MDESLIDEDFSAFPQRVPPTDAEMKADAKKRAAAEKAAKSAAPKLQKAVEKMQEEEKHVDELEEKQEVVRRIKQYYAKFPERITTPIPKNLSTKMKLETLKETLRSVELDMSCAGAVDTAAAGLAVTLGGLQQLTQFFNPLNLQLSGPRADLAGTFAAQKATWRPLIEEFAIKYERWLATSIEKRLLFYVAGLVLLVDRANKEAPAMAEAAEEPADDEALERLSKLFSVTQSQ